MKWGDLKSIHLMDINSYFFLGAGLGFHFIPEHETIIDQRDSSVEIPVFANIHTNFTKTKVAPFVDAKAGTYVTNGSGLYASVSAGCRITINQKQDVNISVGYTYAKYEFQSYSPSSKNYSYGRVGATERLSIKVGYEF